MAKNTCMKKNCHTGCSYSNTSEKQYCCAMLKERCTVCGCHWSIHINSNKIFELKTRNILVTDQVIKNIYKKCKNDKTLSETALASKIQ